MTLEKKLEFIKKAALIHGDVYDYDELEYISTKHKSIIRCIKHDLKFKQRLSAHLLGQGCPLCGQENRIKKRSSNKQDFIQRSYTVHGERSFGYERFIYVNNKTKGWITCKIHSDFEQTPSAHLNGAGCPNCAKELKITAEEFDDKARLVHGDLYDRSEFVYKGAKIPGAIRCRTHGIFWQCPNNHLSGSGCPSCATEVRTKGVIKYSQAHISEDTLAIIGDKEKISELLEKYTIYELSEQLEISTGMIERHAAKLGIEILKSNSSYEDAILQFLKDHNVVVVERNNRRLIKPFEVDLVLPDEKIGIEFCGLYWHSESINPDKNYHLKKLKMMNEIGYKLITIFEDEWLYKRSIVESRLLNKLRKSKKGKGGRELTIRSVSAKEASVFLNAHHIQGCGVHGYARYGAYDEHNLVAVMTFSKPRRALGRKDGEDELLRFATDGGNYPGVSSRLFRAFVREHNPQGVISYADRRWSEGDLYHHLGFKLVHETDPNYWYIKDHHRHYRFEFRKDKIKHLVENGDEKTEREIMLELKYDRIWDCGSLKYEWSSTSS